MSSPSPIASRPDADINRRLIDLRHAGKSWPAIERELNLSEPALRMRANRLRDAGEWTLPNGKPANGAPKSNGRGRPRNPVPKLPVSIRFAPDVANALRTVAACAGLRLGEVFTEAMQRAVARAAGEHVDRTPLGLDPGEAFDLCDGNVSVTLSVNVPRDVYEALVATAPADSPNTVIADAVYRLLRDLNYRLVECE